MNIFFSLEALADILSSSLRLATPITFAAYKQTSNFTPSFFICRIMSANLFNSSFSDSLKPL